MKREEYEERMKDSRYRELTVTNCDSGKDYVFISYRGNSWKTVLTEIVYKLQKEYKLRIYFDKEFASETNLWIDQFIKNMDSSHCKACLCFFDEGYVTSYATLLELMHAMNPRSKLGNSIFPVSFPINWEKLDSADRDTGLGKEDPDNPGWSDEKIAFEREFKSIKKKYPDVEDYYYEGAKLRACDCKDIMAIIQPKNKRDYVDEAAFYKQFIVDPLKKTCPEVFEEESISEYQDIHEEKTLLPIKADDVVPDQNVEVREGYQYTIFGKEYYAGSREQGKLMFDAFEALTEKYPEYAEKLTQRTSVARAEDVKNANTKEADPSYFRGCRSFYIGGNEYLVGTSYGYNAKIAEIKGMFKICGVPFSEFILNGEPIGSGSSPAEVRPGQLKKKDGSKVVDHSENIETNGFQYSLWDMSHMAKKLSDLMHDVFDLIAEKYPEKVSEMAASDTVSSVALKEDVDGEKLPSNKLSYFRASREHQVGGRVYYVGTSYNRTQGIGQIERMLKLCEGNADGFTVMSSPERISHSGGKIEKRGR